MFGKFLSIQQTDGFWRTHLLIFASACWLYSRRLIKLIWKLDTFMSFRNVGNSRGILCPLVRRSCINNSVSDPGMWFNLVGIIRISLLAGPGLSLRLTVVGKCVEATNYYCLTYMRSDGSSRWETSSCKNQPRTRGNSRISWYVIYNTYHDIHRWKGMSVFVRSVDSTDDLCRLTYMCSNGITRRRTSFCKNRSSTRGNCRIPWYVISSLAD